MRAYIRTYSYYSTHRLTRPACADRDAAAARWRMRCCRATGIRTRAPALAPPGLLSHHRGPPRSRGRTRSRRPPPRACPSHTAAGRAGPVAAGCTALPPPGRNATDAHRPPGHRRGRGRTYAAADGAGGAFTAARLVRPARQRHGPIDAYVRVAPPCVRAAAASERARYVGLYGPLVLRTARGASGTDPGDRTLASALAAGSSQPTVPDGSMECDCARARRPVRSPAGRKPARRTGRGYGTDTVHTHDMSRLSGVRVRAV